MQFIDVYLFIYVFTIHILLKDLLYWKNLKRFFFSLSLYIKFIKYFILILKRIL